MSDLIIGLRLSGIGLGVTFLALGLVILVMDLLVRIFPVVIHEPEPERGSGDSEEIRREQTAAALAVGVVLAEDQAGGEGRDSSLGKLLEDE